MKHLRDSSQERLALLEARLTEEKDWRKQLEVDLSAAQAALKKDKEVKNHTYPMLCLTESNSTTATQICEIQFTVQELSPEAKSYISIKVPYLQLQATQKLDIFPLFSTPKALQIGERELKKLRLEVNSLQTECQQGKTLIKSLTQVKGEKAVLEEKVCSFYKCFNFPKFYKLAITDSLHKPVLFKHDETGKNNCATGVIKQMVIKYWKNLVENV